MQDSSVAAHGLASNDTATPIAAESVNPKTARNTKAKSRAPREGVASSKFTIVALGGSAGSLEALEKFFSHLPPHPGMAFVVVVHLLAREESLLPGLLQAHTKLPVLEAYDGVRVRANHVYVIPPGHDMSMLHGSLLLFKPTQAPGLRLPIDFFLQSLAKDAGERAVCIIFSGMGSDGSLGLKLVMENFGMVMAQDPATALYDAMPQAALATEFVDFVLAPELMPAQLLDYVERPLGTRPLREQATDSPSRPTHALQKIFLLIRQ